MSDMSWEELRGIDCDAIRDSADQWKAYVPKMIEQTERLRNDVVDGHLGTDNYESDTADQVREQIKLTAGRFEDDLSDYADIRVATTLLEIAEALEAERLELEEVIAAITICDFKIEGDPHEYEVNLSGDLHQAILSTNPPQWLCDKVGIEKPDGFWDLDHAKAAFKGIDLYGTAMEVAGQHQDWLRAIMNRAHDADDDAAAALSAMAENPPGLPPQLGSDYDEQVEDYKDKLSEEVAAEMEAIANGESDMTPEQVNQWWEDLSASEQEALIAEHPEWVGPTDGLPVEARDTANRDVLDGRLDDLDNQIASIEAELSTLNGDPNAAGMYGTTGTDPDELTAQLAELKEEREQLGQLHDNITDSSGNPAEFTLDDSVDPPITEPYCLLGFGTEGEGQAIVSIGNPDGADNVNTYVPGTGGGLDGANGGDFSRLQTMSRDAYALGGSGTANVLWMDYDAPDNVFPFVDGGADAEAMDTSYAEGAAEDLSSFTDGLRATAEGEPANLTMTGHSYGTTTIGTAASTEGLDVDNMVFAASPGTNVESVHSLGIDPDNIYATRNESDIIGQATDQNLNAAGGAASGFVAGGPLGAVAGGAGGYFFTDPDEMVLGTDPTSEEFGANVIHSEADPNKGAMDNHSTYWDAVNERAGRRDMAEVITGSGR